MDLGIGNFFWYACDLSCRPRRFSFSRFCNFSFNLSYLSYLQYFVSNSYNFVSSIFACFFLISAYSCLIICSKSMSTLFDGFGRFCNCCWMFFWAILFRFMRFLWEWHWEEIALTERRLNLEIDWESQGRTEPWRDERSKLLRSRLMHILSRRSRRGASGICWRYLEVSLGWLLCLIAAGSLNSEAESIYSSIFWCF